eukprot:c15161_g1_i1.p2 GENE.c15161_g1_i1~~c15161_g1_i1.p2  ORF type:complete len:126 (-),score=28.38 c15161_g1_i1:225-602(-)
MKSVTWPIGSVIFWNLFCRWSIGGSRTILFVWFGRRSLFVGFRLSWVQRRAGGLALGWFDVFELGWVGVLGLGLVGALDLVGLNSNGVLSLDLAGVVLSLDLVGVVLGCVGVLGSGGVALDLVVS